MSSTVQPTEPRAYPTSPAPSGPRNGLGTAALVLGIIALITCWTVIGGLLLGLLAIVFGAVGRGRVKRGEASNGGSAVAGIVLGVVSVVLAVVLVAVGVTFVSHHKKAIDNLQACLNKANTQAQRNSCNQQFSNTLKSGNG